MAQDKATSLSGFHTLFNKSVPHILENIFLSLDYDSLKACHEVCHSWKELLSSEPYHKRAKEMLNEKKLCKFSLSGNSEGVSHLLSIGVDPNCERDECRGTPLFYAAMNGHWDVVRLLLEAGAEPDKANRNGATPLYWAARNFHMSVVRLLLDAGAEPDRTSKFGDPVVIRGMGR